MYTPQYMNQREDEKGHQETESLEGGVEIMQMQYTPVWNAQS